MNVARLNFSHGSYEQHARSIETIRETTRPIVGDQHRVYVSYPDLPREVVPGNRILIDDGQIELKVLEVHRDEVVTEVVVGGALRSRKGVNLPHIKASAPSLTEKDIRDLEFGLSHEVDWIALSFVRSRKDVEALL